MKKKLSGPKLVLIGLLVVVIAVVIIAVKACGDDETEIVDPAIPVYTVCGIKGDTTTDDAIRSVELAMNRVFTSRYNIAVKLCLFTESNYDNAVKNAYAMMELNKTAPEAFQTLDEKYLRAIYTGISDSDLLEATNIVNTRNDEYKAKYENTADNVFLNKLNSGEYTKDGYNTVFKGLSENVVIDTLTDNLDIYPATPKLDIILAPNYKFYDEYSKANLLTAIDEQLSVEAKVLKQKIYPTLLTAAKINNRTYGIPTNKPIGEYEYIVFDKELLEKYDYDEQSMVELSDLEEYLSVIKANEPDVVPLYNATTPKEFTYMFGDGSVAIVNEKGAVSNAYTTASLESAFIVHHSLILKYHTLGYLPDETPAAGTRYAVRFVKGDETTIEDMEKADGREYSHSIYRVPSATNDNTVDTLFCLTKYCNSTDATTAIDIIVEFNKDEQIKNYFLYGLIDEHYILDDDGYAVRISQDYIMENKYTGNTYLAYTLQGEDPLYAERAMAQNLASVVSPLIGYTFTDKTIKNSDASVSVPAIDFVSLFGTITNKYYQKLLSGTAGEIDYQKFVTEEAPAQIELSVKSDIEAAYKEEIEKVFRHEKSTAYREDTAKMAAWQATAKTTVDASLLATATSELTEEFTAFYTAEITATAQEGTSEEDITKAVQEAVTAALTQDAINARLAEKQGDIESLIDTEVNNLLEAQLKTDVAAYRLTAEYAAEVNKVVPPKNEDGTYVSNAAQYPQFEADFQKELGSSMQSRIDTLLVQKTKETIKAQCDAIETELSDAFTAALEAFVKENASKLGMTEDELTTKIGVSDYTAVISAVFAADYYSIKGEPQM